MKILHKNVPLLALCLALMMSCSSLMVATAALVGFSLAEDKALATLPMAMQFIAIMLTSIPAAMLMQKIGRKKAFLLSTCFGLSGGALASFAIINSNFWLFVLGTSLVGVFNGFGNYFRFTAADSVAKAYKSKAISYTMVGGVLAAVIGPNLAKYSREWISGAEFAGGYMSTIVLYSLIFIIINFLDLEHKEHDEVSIEGVKPVVARTTFEIVSQAKYIVAVICAMFGYAVMSFVMTATPLAMNNNNFLFDDTSLVIQWHVLAMFAPSFFTGTLIARFGVLNIMMVGTFLGFTCVAINLNGTSLYHFLIALFFLGLSWNFLFVGATSLLTETYQPVEKNKAQAINDFLVFSTVATASLSSGALQNRFGWHWVNIGALPILLIVLMSIIFLMMRNNTQQKSLESGF